MALRLPRESAGYWLVGTAGVSSLFVAVFVLLLPPAAEDLVVRVTVAYAEVFGLVLLFAATFFPREVHRPAATSRARE